MVETAVYGTSHIKRSRRTNAEMESFYDALLDVVEEQRPMTVRQVFYQAEIRQLVEKEEIWLHQGSAGANGAQGFRKAAVLLVGGQHPLAEKA